MNMAQPYRRIGVLSNITARRTAESERQQYTMQLRTLAEVARNITTFITVDELVAFLAAARCEILSVPIRLPSRSRRLIAVKPSCIVCHWRRNTASSRAAPSLSDDALILELVGDHGNAVRLTKSQLSAHLVIANIADTQSPLPLEGLLAARMMARDGAHLRITATVGQETRRLPQTAILQIPHADCRSLPPLQWRTHGCWKRSKSASRSVRRISEVSVNRELEAVQLFSLA